MNWKQPKVYAVKHKDEAIRAASRSGGIFTALSDWALFNGGVVYGCVLTDDFNAVHIRADNAEERNRMRGSKYIQSKLGDTFKSVRADLDAQKSVIFSGTSCQVAGLKKYLGKEYKNLFCVDIVCHGVPSPKVWKEYLCWQEKKHKSKIVKVDFRNKKDYGWRSHKETLICENGKSINSTVFSTLFYGHGILRPSCYECPYKSVMHPGDITIADYWGIEKAAPEFDDNKGVSLVLVNNEIGIEVFNLIKKDVVWKETKIEDSIQTPLQKPFPKPDLRDQFWIYFRGNSFEEVAKRYGGFSFIKRVKSRVKDMIKICKRVLIN